MKDHELPLKNLEELTNFIVDSVRNAEIIDERAFKVISAEIEKFTNVLMATGFTCEDMDTNPQIFWRILLNEVKIIVTLELARAKFEAMISKEKERTKQESVKTIRKSIDIVKSVLDSLLRQKLGI